LGPLTARVKSSKRATCDTRNSTTAAKSWTQDSPFIATLEALCHPKSASQATTPESPAKKHRQNHPQERESKSTISSSSSAACETRALPDLALGGSSPGVTRGRRALPL
jgi:hypothetical protein